MQYVNRKRGQGKVRIARLAMIEKLVNERNVKTARQLRDLLAVEGIVAHEGVISRDLFELGAFREGRGFHKRIVIAPL